MIIGLERIMQKKNQSHLELKEHLSKAGSLSTFLVPHRILACIRFLFLVVPECLVLY